MDVYLHKMPTAKIPSSSLQISNPQTTGCKNCIHKEICILPLPVKESTLKSHGMILLCSLLQWPCLGEWIHLNWEVIGFTKIPLLIKCDGILLTTQKNECTLVFTVLQINKPACSLCGYITSGKQVTKSSQWPLGIKMFIPMQIPVSSSVPDWHFLRPMMLRKQ